MINAAEVKIWNNLVGTLLWDENQKHSLFQWNKLWINGGIELSPLLMPNRTLDAQRAYSFPSADESDYNTFKGLPPFIADALPDSFGNKVIDKWLETQKRLPGSFSPLERLCYTGARGFGALEFFPAIGGKETVVDVEIENLIELAQSVYSENKKFKTNIGYGKDALKEILRIGVSAGGSRPKAVIAYNETSGEIKSGQMATIPSGYSHWLLKLDGVTKSRELGMPSGFGRVEYAYYLMAKDCGINMANCKLLEEGNRAHFMTRRFDRPENGVKLHMQSLCSMANMNFNLRDTWTYEQIFRVMRNLKLSQNDIEQQYRRMVFNIVAKNCDDHTKNVAFLMNNVGEWSFSPAFDVCYAYDPTSKWNQRHLTGINGKFENFTYFDLEKVAKEQGIKNYNEIIEQIRDVIIKWLDYAKIVEVDKTIAKGIKKAHETVNIIK
ncbi:MAG: type II toxin-antitoxin system HipA family toxin [Marinilabiliaceae bacterium]|nr:type II toxin-antitoxin system HipA family toxin [Marinilabiliaceae bacterium]